MIAFVLTPACDIYLFIKKNNNDNNKEINKIKEEEEEEEEKKLFYSKALSSCIDEFNEFGSFFKI